MKKTRFIGCILLSVLLLFCSCSNPKKESLFGHSLFAKAKTIGTEISPKKGLNFVKNEGNGVAGLYGHYSYYGHEDGSASIMYIDYEKQTRTVLCKNKDCLHNSKDCSAWLTYNGGGSFPLVMKDEILHIFFGEPNEFDKLGEHCLARIDRVSLDGTNRKTVYQGERDEIFISGIACPGFAYNEDSVYFMHSKGGSLNLVCFDLSTNTLKNVVDISPKLQYDLSMVGAFNSTLVFEQWTMITSSGEEVNGPDMPLSEFTPTANMKVDIITYNIETEEYKTTFSYLFNANNCGEGVTMGNHYVYLNDDGNFKIWNIENEQLLENFNSCIDLSGEKEILAISAIGDALLLVDILDTSYIKEDMNCDPEGLKRYAIDVQQDKIVESTLYRTLSDNTKIPIQIIDVIGDFYLIEMYQEVESGFDGNQTSNRYAFLGKEDYWNNQEQYIQIKDQFKFDNSVFLKGATSEIVEE